MTQTLRLVSYNLLEGLRPIASPVGERRHFDRARVEAARAVVDGLRQDVLVLSSFLPGAQRARRRLLAPVRVPLSVFGAHDNAWDNAISSRSPILRSHQMRTEDRGGLVAVISVMMSELTVAAYHPNPNRDPADKAADFVRLVADLSGPMIVCGDFNCVSPEDVIDQASMVAASVVSRGNRKRPLTSSSRADGRCLPPCGGSGSRMPCHRPDADTRFQPT